MNLNLHFFEFVFVNRIILYGLPFLNRTIFVSFLKFTLKKTQNDKMRRHYKMTKCVFFVRHCKPFSQKNGLAIQEFKRKFTFGLPRICTLTLCKFSQRQNSCHTAELAEVSIYKLLLCGKEKHSL